MRKAPRLKPGDTLAIVAPSWGGPGAFPGVFDNGLRVLREHFGFIVREMPHVRTSSRLLYENPRLRADDLNAAYADPDVAGIISAIGGNDSIRLLSFLDLDVIQKNPKLIMGYSDATAYLAYLNLAGVGTFYGPSVMAGFSYLENFPEAIDEYRRFFFEDSRGPVKSFPRWSDRYADWSDSNSVGRLGSLETEAVGHRWINLGHRSRGKLWGGCLEVLEMMKGTFAWPSRGFWDDRVLFLETSEEKPTPEQVGYALRNYGIQGVLERIQGLLIARPKSYSNEEKQRLDAEVKKIVVGEFGRRDLPIVSNLDLGHTDPRHIFPLGIEIELDPETRSVELVEEAFSSRERS